ncbi:hypothetical protein [Pseudarthrobacter sp. AL20]|uniref:ATP-dependent DNA ligase n=1 Tax=unclassified Pseudarthrobacter TaxID=2647000 RepID=UPI0032B7A066
MSESIPPALQPPVAVALAKFVKTFPGPKALPGGVYCEPKWDGFRATAFIEADGVTLWSRQGKELTRVSVGVKRLRDDLWPGESAVIDARQVSLTCLSMSTSFRTTRTASCRGRTTGAPQEGTATFNL